MKRLLLLFALSACAAAPVVHPDQAEEETQRPTYFQCCEACRRYGNRPVGTLRISSGWACQCAPWDA